MRGLGLFAVLLFAAATNACIDDPTFETGEPEKGTTTSPVESAPVATDPAPAPAATPGATAPEPPKEKGNKGKGPKGDDDDDDDDED